MTSTTPAPLDPPTAPDGLPAPAETPPTTPAEPTAPTPAEPTVPLPPEPAPDPSGAEAGGATTGSAEPEADNAVEEDLLDAVDPGGQPD